MRMRLIKPKGDSEQVEGLLLKLGWRGEQIEGGDLVVFGLDAVFDNRGQIAEQCLKTVYLQALVSFSDGSLAPGGIGAHCGSDDGSAGGLSLWLIVIVEEHGSQQLTHVPLHIIDRKSTRLNSSHLVISY